MGQIIVLHHALGLTDGVRRFAERLRADILDAGPAALPSAVHTPDLFEGKTFATIEAGVAYVERTGMTELIARGVASVPQAEGPLVVVGISVGVLAAQTIAQHRSGVLGAVLISACLPHRAIGDAWPEGVRVAIHAMEDDPWFADGGDLVAAQELVASTSDASLTLHPGMDHLFVDDSLPEFDPVATDAVVGAVRSMLTDDVRR